MDLRCTYTVTLSDFRKTWYYGLLQRKRNAFRLFACVVLTGIVYNILLSTGALGEGYRIVNYLVLAYGVWMLFVLGSAEMAIGKYLKSEGCLVGKEYGFETRGKNFLFTLPNAEAPIEVKPNKLAFSIELSYAFLLYLDEANLFILPHRALGKEGRDRVREILLASAPSHFSSRFQKKA